MFLGRSPGPLWVSPVLMQFSWILLISRQQQLNGSRWLPEQIHPSVRIVAEAQAICDAVDYYVVPRKIYRLQGNSGYVLEIEATDPPIVQDNKERFISVENVLKN